MNAVALPRPVEKKPGQFADQSLRGAFVVNLEHGLHARPCAMLVRTLQPYQVSVEVEANGEKASGKSILGLMALGAGPGSMVMFCISGPEAHEAMADLERLFRSNFEAAFNGPALVSRQVS